jgi:hypothetical protein
MLPFMSVRAFCVASLGAAVLSGCGGGPDSGSATVSPGGSATAGAHQGPASPTPGSTTPTTPGAGSSGAPHASRSPAPPNGTASPTAPAASGGALQATATSTGAFTIPGATCESDASSGQLRLQFGSSGSGDNANFAMNSGYAGAGTYRGSGIVVFLNHGSNSWFTSGGDAVLTIASGERSGSFSFSSQSPSTESISGSFTCS